jgi:hypothetical protein
VGSGKLHAMGATENPYSAPLSPNTIASRRDVELATTIGMGFFAVASIAAFVIVYAPALLEMSPGRSVRAMSPLLLFTLLLAWFGWFPCVVAGIQQLLRGATRYGLLSLAIGACQILAYRVVQWLLMDSRGIQWGS